jgi:hypothetical protein
VTAGLVRFASAANEENITGTRLLVNPDAPPVNTGGLMVTTSPLDAFRQV